VTKSYTHSTACNGGEQEGPCDCDGIFSVTCLPGWFTCPLCDTDDWSSAGGSADNNEEGDTLVCPSCAYTSELSFEEQDDVNRWRWTHDSTKHASSDQNRGYA
jgi:transcription elongation factor Elf1